MPSSEWPPAGPPEAPHLLPFFTPDCNHTIHHLCHLPWTLKCPLPSGTLVPSLLYLIARVRLFHKRHRPMGELYPVGSYSNSFSFPLLAVRTESHDTSPHRALFLKLTLLPMDSLYFEFRKSLPALGSQPTAPSKKLLNLQTGKDQCPMCHLCSSPRACNHSTDLFGVNNSKGMFSESWMVGWILPLQGFKILCTTLLGNVLESLSRELTANNFDYVYLIAHMKGCSIVVVKRLVSKGVFPK